MIKSSTLKLQIKMKKVLSITVLALALVACSKEANKSTETQAATEDKTVVAQTPNRISYLEISPKTVKCDAGAAQLDCLQVKKVEYKDGKKAYLSQDWENFYTEIEGFNHNTNEQVLIKVKEFDIPNPPADGSSIRYVLDEVIEQTPSK
ncbi:hypothetical protein F889_00740 [Acinetobacter colistiniresistens]|uniref:DUF4377 domain-containing protein n=2 Tax=Acinetobacter colistiniresistens TaxID=280145 RepID=N9RAM3_9GAMM|nr:hypothetical protein F889_00740 [Acinetobacter colistiniresistens]